VSRLFFLIDSSTFNLASCKVGLDSSRKIEIKQSNFGSVDYLFWYVCKH